MIQTMKVKQLKANNDVVCAVDDISFDDDYTSFEIYPHDAQIPSGSIDADTNLEYKVNVPANMYLAIKFFTYEKSLSNVDLKIDVNDGLEQLIALSSLNQYDDASKSSLTSDDDPYVFEFADFGNEYNYSSFVFVYKYKMPGKRIVSVHGHDYFLLRCGGSRNRILVNEQDPSLNSVINVEPIISRVFERDMKMSSSLVNISSICNGSLLVQKLDIPYEFNFKNASNFANSFKNCKNLLYATCSDGIITKRLQSFNSMFQDCINLQSDISALYNVFASGSEDGLYNSLFQRTKLSCNDYNKLANVFWNNNIVAVNSAMSAFLNCENIDVFKIPSGWGGFADTSISYKNELTRENIKQNGLIDICLRYCLGDGNLTETSSNGYEFIPVADLTSDTVDYQGNKTTQASLSINYDLIEIRKLGSKITKIQTYGLAKCMNLRLFDARESQISSLQYGAFYTDAMIQQIKGLENVEVLNRNTFNACSSLTCINDNNEFPKLTAFDNYSGGYQCFNNCMQLSSISFPLLTVSGITLNMQDGKECWLFKNSKFKQINLPSVTQTEYEANAYNWTTYIPTGCSVILNDIVIIKE